MQRAGERAGSFRALWLVAGLGIVFAVWVGFGVGGEQSALYVDDLATLAAALVAAAFCGRAATQHDGRLRLFWWLLAGACAAWAVGEGLWAGYDLGGGSVPVPSWADAGYLAAIPLTAAALLLHPALHGRAIGRMRSLADGLAIAAAFLFVGWTLVFQPLHERIDLTNLGDLVTLAYPLGDVVIIFLVVLVVRGTTDVDRLDLWCLLAGLLMITFSDAIYSYLTNVEDYASGNLIDTGWFLGYLGIALGASYSRPQPSAERARHSARALTPAALVAPFLAILAALGVATVKLELGRSLDGVTLAIAFVLVGLVLIRQALLVADVVASRRERDGTVADRLVAALGEATVEQHVDATSASTPVR